MHEQLNEEVLKRLQLIENLLAGKQNNLLNFNQAAQYLSISHSHLYKMTSQRKIPFHKPSGKYLYFFKHELDAWITRNDENKIMNDELGIMNEEQKPEDGSQELEINIAGNQLGMFDEEEETEPP